MPEENGRDMGPFEVRLSNTHILPNHDIEADTVLTVKPPEAFRRREEPMDESTESFESISRRFFQSIRPQGIRSANDYYASEENRLGTFIDWRHQMVVRKEDLARNGFTYTGSGDKVRCVFCNVILHHWESGDVVEEEHMRNQPQCPFLLGEDVGNIPLVSSANGHHYISDARSEASTRNQNSSRQEQCQASSRPQQIPTSSQHAGSTGAGACATENESSAHKGIYSSKPKHSDMSVEATRLDTFKNWPAQMSQKPEQLAKAGFFYTGDGDKTICFHCGLLVYQWEPNDDPFKEHARWFPKCEYLRLVKGDQFVKDVQSGQMTEDEVMALPTVQALVTTGWHSKESLEKALTFLRVEKNVDIAQVSAETILKTVMELENSATGFTNLGNEHPHGGDFQSLQRENESLREKQQCKICMEQEVEVIFYPCKHFVCCSSCSTGIFICPICRQIIKSRDKVFMA